MLRQQSPYPSQFLTAPLHLISIVYHSSYVSQTLYLSLQLGVCCQQTISSFSTMHRILKTDCAPHTTVKSASFMSNEKQVFSLRNVAKPRRSFRGAVMNSSFLHRHLKPCMRTLIQPLKTTKHCPTYCTESLFSGV